MSAKKTKRNKPAKRQPPTMRERPKMPPISEAMKQWSAMLKAEVIGWPQSLQPMFGMSAFIDARKSLPLCRSRGIRHSQLHHIQFDPMPADLNQRALKSRASLQEPAGFLRDPVHGRSTRRLWWLNQAYEAAKK